MASRIDSARTSPWLLTAAMFGVACFLAGGWSALEVLAHLRDVCRVPIVTGLPFGHVRDKLTLPVGGRARLAVRGGEATLAIEDGR